MARKHLKPTTLKNDRWFQRFLRAPLANLQANRRSDATDQSPHTTIHIGLAIAIMGAAIVAGPKRASAAVFGLACEAAASAEEQQNGIPPGLLAAIGRVESGRRDPFDGTVKIWPWSINVNGTGMAFASAPEAAATVAALLAQGARSIDVGCFQINLSWHPSAFASLSEAFDPAANARYAAHFLLSLYAQAGDWGTAIARYHSARDKEGGSYRSLVFAAWEAPRSSWVARLASPASDRVVVRMSPSAAAIKVFYGAIPMPRS